MQAVLFPYTVSIRKREDRLREALARVEKIRKAHGPANMLMVAELFLSAPLERRETRGNHFREDCLDKSFKEGTRAGWF